MASQSAAEDTPDGIVASYDVYVKPHSRHDKKVCIFYFVSRDSEKPFCAMNFSLPSEVRMKEKSGLVEIDVPVNVFQNYDREKGVKWGEALRKSDQLRGGSEVGSHGLADGFGIGGGQSARPRSARQGTDDEGLTQEALVRDFASSLAQGRVLSKQTLGGQMTPKDSTTPQYMTGFFREDQLHLTLVDQVVQLRPQFHHIDAQAELERGRPTTARTTEPRAIHMTIKPTVDGEEETTDTMAERIRAVQEERWRKLPYIDEDSIEAWEVYDNVVFVENVNAASSLCGSKRPSDYLDTTSAPRAPTKLAKLSNLRDDA